MGHRSLAVAVGLSRLGRSSQNIAIGPSRRGQVVGVKPLRSGFHGWAVAFRSPESDRCGQVTGAYGRLSWAIAFWLLRSGRRGQVVGGGFSRAERLISRDIDDLTKTCFRL